MKTKTFAVAFLMLFALGACNSQNKKNPDAAHGSQNSLDWAGAYYGMLPCADCEGIETVVTINNDNTYLLQTRYVGKDEQVFETSGTFSWDKKGANITLEGIKDAPSKYQVGENKLIQLNMKGKKIKGDLADKYVLTKQQPQLTERYWKLIELNENPVESKISGREAHIILRNEGNIVNGNGGCNSLRGTYSLDGEKITLSQMIMTMMACPNMEAEHEFTQALGKVVKYTLVGDNLILLDADAKPLAKFEVVYLR